MAFWEFYVYKIVEGERVLYIGKGSKRRLHNQIKSFGLAGEEIARFKKESDAYDFERKMINHYNPILNKHPGGNGSKCHKAMPIKKEKWMVEMERRCSKKHVAQFLLSRCFNYFDKSKIDIIRQVANG